MVEVVLAPNRAGVEVRTAGDGGLASAIRAMQMPAAPRRTRSGLYLGFDSARILLQAGPPGLSWDRGARRAVENRARAAEAAVSVLRAARHLRECPMAEVWAAIAGSQLLDRLDEHQARNVAVMT